MIGSGGATIRELTEQTNTTIDISDDGIVKIRVNTADGEEAKHRVECLTAVPEVGKTMMVKWRLMTLVLLLNT